MSRNLYTEHKYSPAWLSEETTAKANSLKANKGIADALPFFLSVIAGRLAKDKRRYLDYGPYWWALKGALKRGGHDYGDAADDIVAREYAGANDMEIVVAADSFRTDYLTSNIVGTNQFILNSETGDWYTLFDADMEEPQ